MKKFILEVIIVGRLKINLGKYAYRFQREPHFAASLLDRDKPYFRSNERLTPEEIVEVESWPSTVNEMFVGQENKRARDHFLLSLRGVSEPGTSTEKIVNKLIHQALAMGGLHCELDYKTGLNVIPRIPPSNDIIPFKVLTLKKFLLEVRNETASHLSEYWADAIAEYVSSEKFYPFDASSPDPRWSEDDVIEDIPDWW
jgi:hypothetical protein